MPSLPRACLPLIALASTVLLGACTAGATPSPEDQADAVAQELGAGWHAEVVADARDGTFVLANPEQAEVWRIGEPTDAIARLTDGTAWGSFWLPALEEASSDHSNVRAVVVDTSALDGDVVSWQINVNPADPGLELTVDELADDLRSRFEGQGLEVDQARSATWDDRDVALVAFDVPAEVFGGEQRYVRQWFISVDEPAAMWSVTCDAPAEPDRTAELCRTGLDGFRIAAPPAQDRT